MKIPAKLKYRLGALLDLFTYAMFWFGLVGFAFNAMTAYSIWIKPYVPEEFTAWKFILSIIGLGLLVMTLEFFVLYKARQHFRNKWEYEQESPIKKDLQEIKKKLGINDK